MNSTIAQFYKMVESKMTPQDILSFVSSLKEGGDKNFIAKLYMEYYKNNSLTPQEKAEIRKHKRKEYMRKRYNENPEVRKTHQKKMREYRQKKKEEFNRLSALSA